MIITTADFDLSRSNTFRIPCRVERRIEFSDRNDIPAVAAELRDSSGVAMVMGAGSDLLFTEPLIKGTIAHSAILTLEMTPLGNRKVRLSAGSGITMDDLVERTCRAELWGLENLSGIPGEVGASAVQNVGAYGCEAGDIIEAVHLYDCFNNRFLTFQASDCRFAYRHSIFKTPQARGRYIIAGVDYILSTTPTPKLSYGNLASRLPSSSKVTPMEVREAVISIRNSKLPDPAVTGSAGSYFTNPILSTAQFESLKSTVIDLLGPEVEVPFYSLADGRVKVPAAWLIDRAGLKGIREGGAGTWPSQPLVIANLSGSCTAADVLAVEHRIVATVRDTFGITLGLEVEKVPPQNI